MAIRKNRTFGISLSDKALKVLQVMGYIDGRKKTSKEKNLSKFISGLVEDHIIFHPGLDEHDINLKVHTADLNELQRQQRAIEEKMHQVAGKIAESREILKSKENSLE